MKKVLCSFVGIFFMLSLLSLSLASCQDDIEIPLAKSYSYTITYQGAGQRIATCNAVSIPSEETSGVVLVYSQVGANNGQIFWCQQPYTDDHTQYYYLIGNRGLLIFVADAGEGWQWNANPTATVKIIVIPEQVYIEMKKKGVNHSNFNEVRDAYNLPQDMETDNAIQMMTEML
ncbi:MAG: hypothetical protein IJU81_09440 [Bacteroidales bacterium]|nr:hypothetical protein [Bacteroidales bacterium]